MEEMRADNSYLLFCNLSNSALYLFSISLSSVACSPRSEVCSCVSSVSLFLVVFASSVSSAILLLTFSRLASVSSILDWSGISREESCSLLVDNCLSRTDIFPLRVEICMSISLISEESLILRLVSLDLMSSII